MIQPYRLSSTREKRKDSQRRPSVLYKASIMPLLLRRGKHLDEQELWEIGWC